MSDSLLAFPFSLPAPSDEPHVEWLSHENFYMSGNLSRDGTRDPEEEREIARSKEADSMLAQMQKVIITPLLEIEALELMEGKYGPFKPMIPASVPLYVALFFKRTRLCTIQAPAWIEVGHLKNLVEKEEEATEDFVEVDKYLFDNAEIFLEHCEGLREVPEIRLQLKQLEEARMRKLLRGMKEIDSDILSVPNLTFYEFRRIKEYLLPHLEMRKILRSNEEG